MKTIKLLVIVALLSSAIVLYAENSNKDYSGGVFVGTWANTDYHGKFGGAAKIIVNPDGTWEAYRRVSSKKSKLTETFGIEDKWVDSEGNIWYKILRFNPGHFGHFELWKFSDSGKWEKLWLVVDYPTEIDPDQIIHREPRVFP